MSLSGNSDHDKLLSLATQAYKNQAIWFLNAFWHKLENQAEKLWSYVQSCSELDLQNGANGTGLDEMMAHRFLETHNETMTVREMREKLRSTGAIEEKERPKLVPLIHVLLFKYDVDWHTLVNASQGDNQEEVERAQQMLKAVQAALEEMVKAANLSKQREQEARQAEADALKAKQELEEALANLKAEEDAYNNKTQELTRKSEEGGVVSRNKAKNELAQHLAEDPLPLRRAKITTEAAVKKAERTAQIAKDAVAAAAAARQAAEAAVEEARAKVDEAQAYLEEVKSKPGSAQGAVWWMERELHEARKYMPSSKGGIAK